MNKYDNGLKTPFLWHGIISVNARVGMNKGSFAVLIILVLCIGFGLGFLTSPLFSQKNASEDGSGYALRDSGNYKYISPLLECEVSRVRDFIVYHPLENSLNEYIETVKNEQKATEVSVYIRDLNNGPWLGINEQAEFSPASLFKIPIMLAYFKLAEVEPGILSQKYTYDGKADLNVKQNIAVEKKLEIGKEYTVDELIYRMIVYSDNNARDILDKNLQPGFQNKVYEDFGFDIPGVTTIYDFTSVRNYASFFRVLYNATYLSSDFSEKALETLSKTQFNGGLKAGIPKNVTVAHKFGERIDAGASQLHDCGIVYAGKTPYVLCVMTKGEKLSELTDVIKNISRIVYVYIASGGEQRLNF